MAVATAVATWGHGLHPMVRMYMLDYERADFHTCVHANMRQQHDVLLVLAGTPLHSSSTICAKFLQCRRRPTPLTDSSTMSAREEKRGEERGGGKWAE